MLHPKHLIINDVAPVAPFWPDTLGSACRWVLQRLLPWTLNDTVDMEEAKGLARLPL
jgi:hypothetical protein